MGELTFGRLQSYPKPISPEVEAKREAERVELRKKLTPSYLVIYDKVVVKESDADLRVIAHASYEQVHALYPEVAEAVIKNWILLAGWEIAIRYK
jgi:hypothetical protein